MCRKPSGRKGSRLQRFVEREGHARVPLATREDGYRLGAWVNSQRAVRVQGKLDPDRERRLEALPGWTWDPREDAWEEGFGLLLRFAGLLSGEPGMYSVTERVRSSQLRKTTAAVPVDTLTTDLG